MVVDDDPIIVQLLRINFEIEGWTVRDAGDGEVALRLAADTQPDVVICDVMMPPPNGLDILRRLHADAQTNEIPVVLLSAKAQHSEIKSGMDAGAADYITKPFDHVAIVQRVAAVANRQR